jgi:1-acyl-sn-glycerol-3-phosphate acyltransferase
MTKHSDSLSVEKMDAAHSNTLPRRTLRGRLWLWWCIAAAGLLLLVLGPLPITFCWLLRRRTWLYPVCLFGAKTWLRLCGARVKVRGLEHLDPQQPYVFIANHRSYLDTTALFYYTGRRIGVLAKKELLKVPILGYGMTYVNVLAIDRSNSERARVTTETATARIRSGVSYGVFAEGTRARPGQLLPFKKGGFYMARDAGVPVVPIAIKNTDALMGKRTGFAQPGEMEMVILPPIPTTHAKTADDVAALALETRARIAAELGCEAVTGAQASRLPLSGDSREQPARDHAS